MQFLNMFFFDIYPYIAGAVFLIGSWLRYDYGQYTWRAASSQMLDRKGMNLASNLFHIGILGIFVGHFFGMLTPHWMYEAWLPIEVKQKMAMFAGGASGVLCLIGGVLLLKRRLFSPRVRATTTGADILILSLLVIQCALGLLTIPFSAQHMHSLCILIHSSHSAANLKSYSAALPVNTATVIIGISQISSLLFSDHCQAVVQQATHHPRQRCFNFMLTNPGNHIALFHQIA